LIEPAGISGDRGFFPILELFREDGDRTPLRLAERYPGIPERHLIPIGLSCCRRSDGKIGDLL